MRCDITEEHKETKSANEEGADGLGEVECHGLSLFQAFVMNNRVVTFWEWLKLSWKTMERISGEKRETDFFFSLRRHELSVGM